jgi:hypothetical protein
MVCLYTPYLYSNTTEHIIIKNQYMIQLAGKCLTHNIPTELLTEIKLG